MVKEHALATRHRAVGMVRGGMKVGDVARQLGVYRRTLHLWLARDRSGVSLENRKGRGRKTAEPGGENRSRQGRA